MRKLILSALRGPNFIMSLFKKYCDYSGFQAALILLLLNFRSLPVYKSFAF